MTCTLGGRHLTSISPSQLLLFKIQLHCNSHKDQLSTKSKSKQNMGVGVLLLLLEAAMNAPPMAYSSALGSYKERGDLVGGTEEGSSA